MVGASTALAASVQIEGLWPTGAITPGATVSFIASASGFSDPVYTLSDAFSASGATTGNIDKAGNYSWTPGIYDAGLHTIMVSVNDVAKDMASTTVNILVASNNVLVTNIAPGPFVSTMHPFTFTVTAPGFTTPYFSVYDSSAATTLTPGNINSSGAFSWKPSIDDLGAHSLTVRATDAYGHSAQTFVQVTVIHPQVSIPPLAPSAPTGSPISFITRVSGLASSTYSIADSFAGTTTISARTLNSSGMFNWTPSVADLGSHLITITAADTYGNSASSTASIWVVAAPATPTTTVVAPAIAPTAVTTATTTATPPTTTALAYHFTTALGIGSRTAAVLELQKRLTALGFYNGPLTGYFGALTAVGVKKFQAAHGIAQVGSVGPATRAVLNQ